MPFVPWVATTGNAPTPLSVALGGTGATTVAAAATALGNLQKVASAGTGGFAKQNATPNILTWTAPNDGLVHSFVVLSSETVTSLETGGGVGITYTNPGGNQQIGGTALYAGGKAAGTYHQIDGADAQANTQVIINQSTALTAGAATVWCEIWAN